MLQKLSEHCSTATGERSRLFPRQESELIRLTGSPIRVICESVATDEPDFCAQYKLKVIVVSDAVGAKI